MPNTFANPWSPYAYESPLAKVFGNLSNTLAQGGTQAQRIKQAEEALKLKREREGITSVADLIGQYAQPGFNRNRLASAAVIGGYDPQDLAVMERYLAANTHGALSPLTDNAFLGAGGAYSSTGGGFTADQNRQERQHGATLAETRRANDMSANLDLIKTYETLAENARQFNQKPQQALVDGQPVFVPQIDTFKPGTAPILSETDRKGTLIDQNWSNLSALDPMQRRIVGAEGTSERTARMYRTKDGRVGRTNDDLTDLVTGAPIPADAQIGTIADTSETFGGGELATARKDIIARRGGTESMIRQATNLDALLARSDAAGAVGVLGSGARVINDIASQTQAALSMAGIEAPPQLRDALTYQNVFRELGVHNAELQSALVDLAYATAQSREPGRLTENDIERALRTIGGNLQDPIAMRRVLRAAVDRSLTDYNAYEGTLRGVYGDALNLPPTAFSSLPPLEAASAPGGEERWERGPDGALRRVQ